jgi:NitT/TauT family transport system substrate-binding protein
MRAGRPARGALARRGAGDGAADPEPAAGRARITRREPLLTAGLDGERLQRVIANQVVTPETREHGIGHVDPARLDRASGIVTQGLQLPRRPAAAEILDTRFLPAAGLPRLH